MLKTIAYDWFGVNQTLFFAVNSIRSSFFDEFMVLGSRLGSFWNMPWVVAMLLGMIFLRVYTPQTAPFQWIPQKATVVRALLVFLLAYALGMGLVALLKVGLQMPRPAAAMLGSTVHIIGAVSSGYSFPSGHAAFSMLLVVAFWPNCRYLGRTLLVLFAAWVGFSRISVGAHFPVDVLAGYLCGGLGGWASLYALDNLLGKHPRDAAIF